MGRNSLVAASSFSYPSTPPRHSHRGRVRAGAMYNTWKQQVMNTRVSNEKNRQSQIQRACISVCRVVRPEHKTDKQRSANCKRSFLFAAKNKTLCLRSRQRDRPFYSCSPGNGILMAIGSIPATGSTFPWLQSRQRDYNN